jgi:predicted nucleotidyltransferase
MKFGLDKELLSKLKTIFKQFPEIEKVIIFGSRAKGNYRPGSDVDIALLGKINNEIISKLIYLIDELNSPYKFYIINYKTIKNQDLIQHLERVGKQL